MTRKDGPPGFEEFDAKLRRVRGEPEQAGPAGDAGREAQPGGRLGSAWQVGIELVAGVAGGALIGYALDSWLETRPFLLVVFFFLGSAAGILNAYRYLRRLGKL
jgi:ATP synthase protein I